MMDLDQLQFFENEINKFLAKGIKTKSIIDVGAHVGSVLKYFLLNDFTVYAFEPADQNREKLIENYKGFKNLFVFSEALSNSTGVKDFYLAMREDGTPHEFYHSLEKLPEDQYHRKGTTVRVKTVSIDELILHGKIPKEVGYLKIDTEGHDLKVLEGASNLICDVISVEFWSNQHSLGASPSPPSAIIKLLKERGYENFIIISHEKNGVHFYTQPLTFEDDSWGNILFFDDSNADLFNSTLEFCSRLSSRAKTGGLFSLLTEIFSDNPVFIDIGAHTGKFTDSLIEYFPFAQGVLFEPTYRNYEILKNKFWNKTGIDIINCALDIEAGKRKFYYTEDSAQNSLLLFDSENTQYYESEIETNTLDNFFLGSNRINRIDLIKIDTQGNDLNILKGGMNTIQKYKPVILTEFIFISLYKNQGLYFDQFNFFRRIDYNLAGIYNMHYTQNGVLAFADFLFLPSTLYEKVKNIGFVYTNFACVDPMYLAEENENLRKICDERLSLINFLSEEADKRLKIIETLDAEISKLKRNK